MPSKTPHEVIPIGGPRSRAEHDAAVVARADYFTAVRHLGRGRFERVEFATLDLARDYAQRRADAENVRFMLYGVAGKASAHIENVNPK